MDRETLAALERAAGRGTVFSGSLDRELYAYDATGERRLPDAVVRAVDTAQIGRIMALCTERRIPVTPRGAGTGLSGGSLPMRGGVVLDLAGMNRILELSAEHMLAVVQPGVINADLQRAAGELGLFFPPDPASLNMSTLGGNLAENAGGPRAVKYGVTGDHVLGLRAVLPDGRLVRTGGRTVKNVAGYDLTRLIVGSEGTLAVIVEATLRLAPLPEHKVAVNAFFRTARDAALAVQRVLRSGIRPVALEFLDHSTLAAVARSGLRIPETARAMVLVDVDGPGEVTRRHAAQLRGLLLKGGKDAVVALNVSNSASEYEEVWRIRRSVGPAVRLLGSGCLAEDIVVPLGSIAEMVDRVACVAESGGLYICCYGHAGDGNLHVNIIHDREDPTDVKRAWNAAARVFEAAVELRGSISGEHGIGMIKLDFLERSVDPVALDLMRDLKRLWDPEGILNPDKAVPGAGSPETLP